MVARFDIEPLRTRTNLLLTIDDEAFSSACEDEKIARFVTGLQKARIFHLDTDQANSTSRITARSNGLKRYSDVPGVAVVVLDSLYNNAAADETLPMVRMSHGLLDTASGRRGMQVALRWPDVDLDEAALFATHHMQRFAQSVDLHGNPRLNVADDMVYTRAIRERGIVIETNPLGSCNISAGGYDYRPELPVVDLWQHNIYSPQQQLTCLMGAVSFATAALHI